jgi:putative glutamine amidotransferase
MDARIGITTSLEKDASEGNRQTLRLAYVRAVERAGGVPVVVPMLESERATRTFAEELDGLVVTGGPAVTDGLVAEDGASSKGAALPDQLGENAHARRRSDGWLLDAFAETSRPVLGICYGMQLINARRGGRLWADVEHQVDGAGAHSQKRGAETHDLSLVEGTHLRRLLGGRASVSVNTRHLQALASVGKGLRVSARAAPDGVIEAIESPDGTFIGVQFHPERLGTAFDPLFCHLVERAAQARPLGEPASSPPVSAQRG